MGLICCRRRWASSWSSRARRPFSPTLPKRPSLGPSALARKMKPPSSNTCAPREDQGSMEIAGQWDPCLDGMTHPMVPIEVRASDGALLQDLFLIDTGADRTVLSAFFAGRLNLPASALPPQYALVGISGRTAVVLTNTTLEFTRTDRGPARVHGQFAAFVDPRAID